MHLDPLPQDGGDDDVRCLDRGSFIASIKIVHANCGSEKFHLYNWCLLIHDRRCYGCILWDLGMTSVGEIQYLCLTVLTIPDRIVRAMRQEWRRS